MAREQSQRAIVPFLISMMLLTGVCNTLLTKYQDMQCVADCDTELPKTFEQPVLQTLQMFIGESACWLVVFITFLMQRFTSSTEVVPIQDIEYEPVMSEDPDDVVSTNEDPLIHTPRPNIDPTNIVVNALAKADEPGRPRTSLQGWRVGVLALPALCDILATTLMNVGLLFVAASIYQMTRGALVLFVGVLSVCFLHKHLSAGKWFSLLIVVLGVAVVGLAGVLDKQNDPTGSSTKRRSETDTESSYMHNGKRAAFVSENHSVQSTVLGVLMIAAAQVFTACQFVVEESIMERYSMDPIQVVGWEGTFGFTITLIGMGVLHLCVGSTDRGRGGYFDARAGLQQVFQNPTIATTSLLIMISIGGFNFFGLSVTRMISATSRSTIDTCRTLFIWLVSLGLGWESFKWLQIVGFALLVWGTAIFNDVIRPPTTQFLRRIRS